MLWKLIVLGFIIGGLVGCGSVMDGAKEVVHGVGNMGVGAVKDTVENVDCAVNTVVGEESWKCMVEEDKETP